MNSSNACSMMSSTFATTIYVYNIMLIPHRMSSRSPLYILYKRGLPRLCPEILLNMIVLSVQSVFLCHVFFFESIKCLLSFPKKKKKKRIICFPIYNRTNLLHSIQTRCPYANASEWYKLNLLNIILNVFLFFFFFFIKYLLVVYYIVSSSFSHFYIYIFFFALR